MTSLPGATSTVILTELTGTADDLERSGVSVGDISIGASLAPPRAAPGNELLNRGPAPRLDQAIRLPPMLAPGSARIGAQAPEQLSPSSLNPPWNIASSGPYACEIRSSSPSSCQTGADEPPIRPGRPATRSAGARLVIPSPAPPRRVANPSLGSIGATVEVHEAVLTYLNFVAVGELPRVDPVVVDVGAVEAADVTDREARRLATELGVPA